MPSEPTTDSMPSAPSGPISSLIPAVARAHRALAADLLRRVGLYPGQELLLMLLWQRDGRSQNELARALLIEPPTAAKTVRRLREAGFVGTDRSTLDARKIVVSLTDAGRSVQSEVEAIWGELERRTIDGLTMADQQRLHTLLARVDANVKAAP